VAAVEIATTAVTEIEIEEDGMIGICEIETETGIGDTEEIGTIIATMIEIGTETGIGTGIGGGGTLEIEGTTGAGGDRY
jgi:hypothetical protein